MEESIFSEMSNYEVVQLILTYRAAVVDDLTLFISILFGFLVVSYLVGAKLSRVHFVGLCVVYSTFALLLILGIVGVQVELRPAFAALEYELPPVVYVLPTVLIVSWLLSLAYSISLRVGDANT